jgi:hypothetical protein
MVIHGTPGGAGNRAKHSVYQSGIFRAGDADALSRDHVSLIDELGACRIWVIVASKVGE